MMANLYPIALDLRGRRCLVVGGGAVGERKVRALVDAGADVGIVAPEVTDTLSDLIHDGKAAHINMKFLPQHLDGAYLVIAATDRPEVNAEVTAAARSRRLLVNRADDSEFTSDFVTMATVRRGDLLLALTTGGAGPAVAARLRRELEAQFGPEWEPYLNLLREMRETAKQRFAREEDRAAALRRLAGSEVVLQKIAEGDADGARREALGCLS